MMGRSKNADSSAKEVVGDDEAGLGGNRWIDVGPEGAGLRREATESMAVSGLWGGCLETGRGIAASEVSGGGLREFRVI